MQEEWQFWLGLHVHPGRRPLFIPGGRSEWHRPPFSQQWFLSSTKKAVTRVMMEIGYKQCAFKNDSIPSARPGREMHITGGQWGLGSKDGWESRWALNKKTTNVKSNEGRLARPTARPFNALQCPHLDQEDSPHYSPPSINVTLINVNSLYLLTISYSLHIDS